MFQLINEFMILLKILTLFDDESDRIHEVAMGHALVFLKLESTRSLGTSLKCSVL